MSLTKSQKEAVAARGNVLVIAGAGTGKTRTLVERCLSLVLDEQPPVSIDEVLMVTFTDAAAAEMRKRIRARLEEVQGAHKQRCAEQLALLDSAFIGTIHSFCYDLIRQHFYELGIDPQSAVMPKEESDLLASETLHDVLVEHYAGNTEADAKVRDLVRVHGNGSDEEIRKHILKIHHHTQTLHNPAEWFDDQINQLAKPHWRELLENALPAIRTEWMALFQSLTNNLVAGQCLGALQAIGSACGPDQFAGAIERALDACDNCPKGRKGAFLEPLKQFFEDAAFLLSLLRTRDGINPLEQDWEWFREPMLALLTLSKQFSEAFARRKRDFGVLDFHDLEQLALRLLWNSEKDYPTAIALEWREKLRFVFVDEYQDINRAQDQIIRSLSRHGEAANRFLVGDVKQSIYRFRLANPGIFRNYAQEWKGSKGTTIPLSENFRSRESLLQFTNQIFSFLMRAAVGGVDYSGQALQFGAPGERKQLAAGSDNFPRVEMHLRVKGRQPEDSEDGPAAAELAELLDAEKEARMVGIRLLELVQGEAAFIWDEAIKQPRRPEWGDVAILLRAPSKKAESYSKAFTELGIPLEVARRGFYDATEVTDLLCLLQVLDNPLQDIALIAVLHSPIGNFTLQDLAHVRLAAKKVPFFNAVALLARSQAGGGEVESARERAQKFMGRFQRWRRLARQAPVSDCLETVLAEAHYREWLMAQDRGAQRHANVQRLVNLAREFDQFQRRGLMRFLSFVESQKESDVEPAVAANGQTRAVTLMSMHQSKGLEFPVVVLPDLGKKFNESDLRGRLMLSEEYGLCADIKPPHTRQRYPSLPLWLARRAERRELLGEELRLLYVGMTRARDMLIMSASISGKQSVEIWQTPPIVTPDLTLAAKSAADWLGFWFAEQGLTTTAMNGETKLVRWKNWGDSELCLVPKKPTLASEENLSDTADAEEIAKKLGWAYPHKQVTTEPAKSSVSAIRRRVSDIKEEVPSHVFHWTKPESQTGVAGAERGSAHHIFLERMTLKTPCDLRHLKAEADAMVKADILGEDQINVLDLEGIQAFWSLPEGQDLLENQSCIRREIPFTMKVSPAEIAALSGNKADESLKAEFVVVQGIADLAAVLENEIWLFDFKTDKATLQTLANKVETYRPQMQLYARALATVFRKPVTRSYLYFISLRQLVSTDEPATTDSTPRRKAKSRNAEATQM